MATCLARAHGGLPVPASVRDELFRTLGLEIRVAWADGCIKLGGGATTFEALHIARASERDVLPLGPEIMTAAGFQPGDIVAFEKTADDTWELRRAGAMNLPREISQTAIDGFPLPPEWLIQAFIGVPDQMNYLHTGRSTWAWLQARAATAGVRFDEKLTILDFGCGCGRVLRNIDFSKHDVLGCDLYGAAIEWCAEVFPPASFQAGFTAPPANYPSESVDFLYAISVLTHLDEDMQRRWLSDWQRIVRKGGLVMATFNGDDYVQENLAHTGAYYDDIQSQFRDRNGIAFIDDNGWKGVFPDFYQTAYHHRDYVRSMWGEYFDILELAPTGDFVNKQNIAIMRKR